MTSLIQLELYTQGEDVKYKGRLIGLITNEEFNALVNDKTIQNRIYTKASIPLTDIMGLDEAVIEDMRLVMAVKTRDDENVPGKMLFVSDMLSIVANETEAVDDVQNEVILNTNSQDCIFVKEVKDL